MNAMILNLADLMFSNQTNAKPKTKQGSHFGDLLLQQSGTLPAWEDTRAPLQQSQEQQLADMYENIEELLPDEVIAILKDNAVLQEEIAALVMENAASQQEFFSEGNDEQERLLIENLLSRHLSLDQVNQSEMSAEAKVDLQTAIDIYNEIANLLQGIEKVADVNDTSSLLAQLLKDWEQFFQENPELDKQEVLDRIYQQNPKAESSIFDQTVNQMVYEMLQADLPGDETNATDNLQNPKVNKATQIFNDFMSKADSATAEEIADLLAASGALEEINNDEHVKTMEVNQVLQELKQFMLSVDSTAAERAGKQTAALLIESGLMEEEQLSDIWANAGQTGASQVKNGSQKEQQARIQQFIQVISQQLQRADSDVAEQAAKQIMKQLQEWNLSEEIKAQPPVAHKSGLTAEGLQRVEARIAEWLQSIFKEISPGVIKRNSDVQLAAQSEGETVSSQPGKAETEVVHRIEPKMAAWLQTSFQDASPAVFKQDSLPTSRVEQFMVHMGQTDSSKALSGKELIDKIETIVQSQRLQNFVRGQNPISIQLRPENLGEMTIRFIQANGELTVQMLVSSKAVKDVLESNLHQLRNVFSPHQVTIEKQDNLNAAQTDASKNTKENQSEQQHSGHQEASSDSNEQESASETESFESFMEKLLAQNIEEQI